MKKVLLSLAALSFLSASAFAADGAALYKKCATCHGKSGEKSALNKSKIIKDMSKDEIKAALHGYKDGSYGGASKAMMKGQVKALDDEKIDALADYITSLK